MDNFLNNPIIGEGGIVITAGNYKTWKKGEIDYNTRLVYYPDHFRPPAAFYKKHGIPLKVADATIQQEQPTNRKRGRPSGTGTKGRRINFRCSNEVAKALYDLQQSGWYNGKSIGEIISTLVLNNASYLL